MQEHIETEEAIAGNRMRPVAIAFFGCIVAVMALLTATVTWGIAPAATAIEIGER